ncbi:MAG: zinc metallopeptidase [Bacillota bacterium]|jgi:Zn-dependent membrane protease YugP
MFWFGGPGTIFVLLAFVFAVYAQNRVSSVYNRYSRIGSRRGMTGGELARELLRRGGLYDVTVEPIGGRLTDHYDPRTRRVRLSQEIYHGNSLAALGIAAHETGHAMQHQEQYAPLHLRNAFVPVAQFGSQLAWPMFLFGLLFNSPGLADLGILLFLAAVIFQVITLPVEFNASRRAVALLSDGGYLTAQEIKPVQSVLQAAALTYVAAAATAVAQLLRLVLLRNSRRG